MAISVPGVGSSLDVNSIVSQLMAVERRPLQQLDSREASFQAQLSAFGSIRSALSQFQGSMNALASASRYQSVTAASSDSATIAASAVGTAAPGTYSIEISKLAQSQRLVAAGQASSSASIGTGTLTFEFGTISGGSFDSGTGTYSGATFASSGSAVRTVTIAPENSTLTGIRDAINAARVGVTASIVNDGTDAPYRLVLAADQSGQASALRIGVSGDAALSSLLAQDVEGTQSLAQTAAAQNAQFRINGVAISKPSNTVTDALEGVTLTLSRPTTTAPVTVNVARDTGAIQNAAQSFVRAYNDLNKTLQDLSAFNAETRKASVLTGDPGVRTLQSQLRAVFNQPLAGGIPGLRTMSDLGIAFQRDGTLSLDATRLAQVANASPDRIAGVFAPLGKSVDPQMSVVSAGAGVTAGDYAVNVSQLASRGTVTGSAPAALTITAGVNDTLQLSVDGIGLTVTVPARTYASAAALAAELQSRINGDATLAAAGKGVQVGASGGVLTASSNLTGSSSRVQIDGGSAASDLFGAVPTSTDGVDVAGTINGEPASGAGDVLSTTAGLLVRVSGGALGDRGVINYTVGFAAQLAGFASAQLGSNGALAGRTDGINRTIASIGDQRTSISRRLDDVEKRYREQFAALDVLVSNLSQTSNFLSQQLSALGGSRN